jgi:outer membrane protein assembly factor BamB
MQIIENYNRDNDELEEVSKSRGSIQSLDGPMDSAWPMYCHDVRHTGRSQYSTADNTGHEKWRIRTDGWADGSPVIDNDGIIYIGAKKLYAIYPNGTIKWEYDIPHKIVSAPAIDKDGIIYFGTIEAHPNYLYAIYTTNGTLKWKYNTGGDDIWSSPAIGYDSVIYFGTGGGYPWYGHINAMCPNGTLKWRYETGHKVYSSPAIGNDGIVYCGSDDGNMYALYPNNGTLKWKFGTGDWVGRGPSIADDGTVYFGSWDGYLYAVYPNNGTLKWKTGGHLAGTTPITGTDGTIYVGSRYLTAIYPNNGSIKWTFNLGSDRQIMGSNPCISSDGTIYLGVTIYVASSSYGGEIIAIDSNGIEKWRESIADQWVHSSPAIGEDGTVYIGSTWKPSDGFLHAFGSPDPNAPDTPTINGPTNGKVGTSHEFTFTTIDPNDDDVFYYITWGDGTSDGWLGPHSSGEIVKVSHTWSKEGTYVIQAQAKDTNDLKSDWGTLTVTMPRDKATQRSFFNFLQSHPNMFPILQRLLNL